MARRTPRIAEHLLTENISITFDESTRRKAETALGKQLPSDIWQELENVTSISASLAKTEKSSFPAKTVMKKLKDLKKAVATLRTVVDPNQKPEQNWLSIEQIHHVFFKQYEFKHQIPGAAFVFLLHSIDAMTAIASVIERDLLMKDQRALATPTGLNWDFWIFYITDIFKRIGLPVGGRKDGDKQSDDEQASGFVKFIEILQSDLPTQFKRSTHSRSALAQSIARARMRFKLPGPLSWDFDLE